MLFLAMIAVILLFVFVLVGAFLLCGILDVARRGCCSHAGEAVEANGRSGTAALVEPPVNACAAPGLVLDPSCGKENKSKSAPP